MQVLWRENELSTSLRHGLLHTVSAVICTRPFEVVSMLHRLHRDSLISASGVTVVSTLKGNAPSVNEEHVHCRNGLTNRHVCIFVFL